MKKKTAIALSLVFAAAISTISASAFAQIVTPMPSDNYTTKHTDCQDSNKVVCEIQAIIDKNKRSPVVKEPCTDMNDPVCEIEAIIKKNSTTPGSVQAIPRW